MYFIDDESVLAQRDLEWLRKNIPQTGEESEMEAGPDPPRRKVARKKVRLYISARAI